MRLAILLLGIMIAAALLFKSGGAAPVLCVYDEVLILQMKKAEAVHEYWENRVGMLRNVHQHNHKDIMEAELNMRLSWLDVEIARAIMAGSSKF
jgi:hypothetical protein